MKLQLNQEELIEAVKAYVSKMVKIDDAFVEVDFTAGRGDKGLTVDIEITPKGEPKAMVEPERIKAMPKEKKPELVEDANGQDNPPEAGDTEVKEPTSLFGK